MKPSAGQVLPDALRELLAQSPAPWWLAFSGGMDSTLLLHALAAAGLSDRVKVLHVNHGLHPSASEWARHCQQQSHALGFEFICETLQLTAGRNLEARAREARYRTFARHVGQGSLLLAQHQDDQAETLLLRLLRGSGVTGLSAMRPVSRRAGMTLLRPLLDYSRVALQALAQEWKLTWLDDPSNLDSRFERNWLRHQVIPLLQQREPATVSLLARSAGHLRQAAALLDELAQMDYRQLADGQRGLPLAALRQASRARRHNLLRYWLADKEPWPPGETLLDRVDQELLPAAPDRNPRIELHRGVLTRFRDRLYWVSTRALLPLAGQREWQLEMTLQWQTLSLRSETGFASAGQLALPSELDLLQVATARGGETLLHHGQHQRLVECWRVAGIPPWLRRRLPLFYLAGELVAAAGVGVADNWRVAEGKPARIIHWSLPADHFGL